MMDPSIRLSEYEIALLKAVRNDSPSPLAELLDTTLLGLTSLGLLVADSRAETHGFYLTDAGRDYLASAPQDRPRGN